MQPPDTLQELTCESGSFAVPRTGGLRRSSLPARQAAGTCSRPRGLS
ncbi:hypothetical protein HMPREF0058_1765 [Actinomyces urogenitalis DSM 15434]|uniref:Uncharacterized protein n=1 Tax=Actinomyces urogenitalis DSM 15434 TaxID=525246 RepID=C0W7C1_9ACTO|nr:hypothetical protein HMPREF0058_1765 [Actinomyces urogenitalis DSM 15434]